MEESQGRACSTCGVERGQIRKLQTRIRQLTEKLEYSQLQNGLLTAKCDQMNQKLHETVFKGRSSVSTSPVPRLPNEILRDIFSLATEFEGLAFACWSEMDETNWNRSNATRRAIPMVCRQWHMIGIEFLFEHLVLRTSAQLSSLLGALGRLNPSSQDILIGYVNTLEFDVRYEMDGAVRFKELALCLVEKLRAGQLRRFGVDCGRCDGERTSSVSCIASEVVKRAGQRLKVLHLCCMDPPNVTLSPQAASGSGEQGLWQALSSATFPLQTLSLMGGYWNQCTKSMFVSGRLGFLPTLGGNARLITTLFLNCASFSVQSNENILQFLDKAARIDTFHFIPGYNLIDLPRTKDILDKMPRLKRLFITPTFRPRASTTWPTAFAHSILEEITIVYITRWESELTSTFIGEMMSQIDSCNYPSLKRITMHGFFPNGCLDPDYLLSSRESKRWITIIDDLGRKDISLVNQQGQPIHLWYQRHGLIGKDRNNLECSDSSSDEDEWYETSNESNGVPPTSSEDSNISDDSDDRPYRYTPQRDLQWVYSEEEGEEEQYSSVDTGIP